VGFDDFTPVDTSATASSVRLSAISGKNKIELSWHASVPWTNVLQASPWHRIYRGAADANDEALILIDSVDVTKNDFVYADDNVNENEQYRYKVMTRGGYGNPLMGILNNYSQSINLYPQNNLLPCTPKLYVQVADCEQFLADGGTCNNVTLSSSILWEVPAIDGCRTDIEFFDVYAANPGAQYELLASHVTDTFYIEKNLNSLARCYRVTAIDKAGHVSEFSNAGCNDNCIYYELPNVFTPNGDGCNDTFSAYDPATGGSTDCTPSQTSRCARFVENVKLRVYNRWGKDIYSYNSENGGSIYINWDGRDRNGITIEPAVYYYVADIEFNTTDLSKKNQQLKGWIHVVQ
jgi:hypothetical protein